MNRKACHARGLAAAMGVVGAVVRRRARPYVGAAVIAVGLSGGFDALAGGPAEQYVEIERADLGDVDGDELADVLTDEEGRLVLYAGSSSKGCAWGPPAPPAYVEVA
jgi:hypothetical protein